MGFKSFPERVSLTLSPGLSAVVGPNGCGKSNLVDAVRWVMGEQSPKQLRGGRMDDVLFNGSQGRGPSPMAEVSLTLASEEAAGAGPAEFEITRRLFRGGDGEYLINRTPCRLRDVNQFFMDTGMGARAYAIIEQGRVTWLVDARPEERRILIDEAAGITRYKAQKKEAERKLAQAAENLARLELVMDETKKRLNSLNRSAAKALKHQELKKRLRSLDLNLAARRFLELSAAKAERDNQQAASRRELEMILAETSQAELAEAALKLELGQAEKVLEEFLAARHEVQAGLKAAEQEAEYLKAQREQALTTKERLIKDLERLSAELDREAAEAEALEGELQAAGAALARARAERAEEDEGWLVLKNAHEGLTARRSEKSAELSDYKAARLKSAAALDSGRQFSAHHAERLETARREKAALAAGLEEAGRRRSALEAEQRRLAESLTGLVQEEESWREEGRARQSRLEQRNNLVQARRTELAAARAKLETLAAFKASGAWFSQGLRELMSADDFAPGELIGPLAEHLDTPAGFEGAVETALGERLGWLIVRNRRVMVRALERLRAGKLGRCGFILADEVAPEACCGASRPDYLAALLGPELTWAESLDEDAPPPSGRGVLSRSGAYLAPRGWGVGGASKGDDPGLLSRLKELDAQAELTARLEEEIGRLERDLAEAAALVDQAREMASSLKNRRLALETERSGHSREQAALAERLKALQQSSALLETEEAQAREALGRLVDESEEAGRRIGRLAGEEARLERELRRLDEELAFSAERLEKGREARQEALLALKALEEGGKRLAADRERVKNGLPAKARLKAERQAELAQGGTLLAGFAERLARLAEVADEGPERLAEAEQKVTDGRLALDHIRVSLNQTETALKEARKKREDTFARINQRETEALALKFELDKLSEKLLNDWRVIFGPKPPPFEVSSHAAQRPSAAPAGPEALEPAPDKEPAGAAANQIDIRPAALISYLKPEALAEEPLIDRAEERREELKNQLLGLGEVSVEAIEEHKALLARYEDYRGQYDDLKKAMGDLENSIAKINRTCRLRFSQTFKEVDAELRRIFPVLFEGGEGFLSLTKDDDPLECGVEINVQPPGKKLTLMSLLSGGEKALTALALIFALYLIKPSPFCLLDEIDAPLDEANIDRFNRLLRELTQSSQVILITHNKRTMQISRKLYGVTMESPGVSKLVSVDLAEMDKEMEIAHV